MELLILDEDELYDRAAELFAQYADEAVEQRGVFTAALSGGSTPKRLYSLLAERFQDRVPWSKVHVFFSDERCVPPDHPDSNYRMAYESLISRVDIPPENVHRMKGEKEPGDAAAEYAEDLRKVVGREGMPKLDLILLGMGEDGHTASIFPGSEAVDEASNPVISQYVPKLNTHRLTLSPPVLMNGRRVLVLVTGPKKAAALEQVLQGPYEPEHYPAQLLREASGEVLWLVDPEAASVVLGDMLP
jgi:6-phosphogluconolactonase